MTKWMDNVTEYVLIALVVLMVVVAVAYFVTRPGPGIAEFTARAAAIEECLQSEQFTRDECIMMFSGGVR